MKTPFVAVLITSAALLVPLLSARSKPSSEPALPNGITAHFPFDTTEEGGFTPCQLNPKLKARVSNVRWSQAWNKSGFSINGNNSLITVPECPLFATSRFTLAMHFKTYKVWDGNRILLSKGSDRGYYLAILGSSAEQGRNLGRLCFSIQGKRCLSDSSVSDGAWYNVIVTVDNKIARMYIDGKKQKSEAILKKTFIPVEDDLKIGNPQINTQAKDNKKNHGFEGSVDELIFYNRALNEREAANLFYCSVPHYERKAVQWRINDLDDLLERGLITEKFYANRMKELMTE